MRKTGFIALAVLFEFITADVRTGVNHELAQRFKRSPNYDCGPPRPPPRFWPQPPPPPFWRHHHHPPPWESQQYQNQEYQNQEHQNQEYSKAENANGGGTVNEGPSNTMHCTTCGENGSNGNNAVSNAKSETGQAVAVAIARAPVS